MDCLDWPRVRELDMRASPYDLTGVRFRTDRHQKSPPDVPEYIGQQGVIALRAAPLRAALADLCERLLIGATETKAMLPAGF